MEIIYEIISKQNIANSETDSFCIKKAINAINTEYNNFLLAEESGL